MAARHLAGLSLGALFAAAASAEIQSADSTQEPSASTLNEECRDGHFDDVCDQSAVRTQENVIREADDAFGATIGRESIGIYAPSDVRGFSALAAGNARINGLFFDQVAGPSRHIRQSTSIRVGLSALEFAFPAPTGVVDYDLVRDHRERSYSVTLSADSYQNVGFETDLWLPLAEGRLAIGAGGGVLRNEFVNGGTRTQSVAALSAVWRPTDSVEFKPFWTRTDTYDNTIAPYFAPADDNLPVPIPRRRFLGQNWAQFDGAALLYGVTGRIELDDQWLIELGAFRSVFLTERDTFVLFADVQSDRSGRYLVFTDPPGTTTSTSGEARLSHALPDGPRTHLLIASFRGRDRRQLFGGSDVQDYGRIPLDAVPSFQEPVFGFSEQSVDHVEQFGGGVSYSGRWRNVGSLAFGFSKTEYRKRVNLPMARRSETSASPWLFNGSIAVDLGDRLSIYAAYTRGLEDNGSAPQNATNRNEVLPAIITRQREAGLRWAVTSGLTLVGGVFDIRKPYFSTNAAGLFTRLGSTRSRGVELSLSGEVCSDLSLVAGMVLLDPSVSSAAVSDGVAGARPVGLPSRRFDINVDWRTPIDGVSLDFSVRHQSSLPANTLNTVFIPRRTLVDIGVRYEFEFGATAATLRVFARNIGNVRGWELRGSGTYDLIDGRVFGAYLSISI